MGRTTEASEASDALRRRVVNLEKLALDMWSFIENVTQEDPTRTDKFFDLRQQFREVIQGARMSSSATTQTQINVWTTLRECLVCLEHPSSVKADKFLQPTIKSVKALLEAFSKDAVVDVTLREIKP